MKTLSPRTASMRGSTPCKSASPCSRRGGALERAADAQRGPDSRGGRDLHLIRVATAARERFNAVDVHRACAHAPPGIFVGGSVAFEISTVIIGSGGGR